MNASEDSEEEFMIEKFYPQELKEVVKKIVKQSKINEFLLKFVVKLLRDVKSKKIHEDCLGDGWSMQNHAGKQGYKIKKDVYGFLFRLGDYGMEGAIGYGDSEYGRMLYTIKEVERELKKVAKKLKINLDLK